MHCMYNTIATALRLVSSAPYMDPASQAENTVGLHFYHENVAT